MAEPIVRIRGASFRYGARAVLERIDLDLREGEFLAVVGPNGSGKSTLLKGILGLLPPTGGRVEIRGGRKGVRFGYVPQREAVDAAFPVTAFEVVAMSRATLCGPLRWPGREGRRKALGALEHVGVAGLADRLFRDLSGGQQQRVLIARALALEPHVLLLDEPTNGMDLESGHALMELVAGFHRDERLTVVLVSHDLNIVVNYASSLVLIDRARFLAGPMESVLTEAQLRSVYGTDVRIAAVEGRKVVVPMGGRDTS